MIAPTALALLGSSTKLSALGAVNAALVTGVAGGVKSLAWLVTPVTPPTPVRCAGTYSNHAWLAATRRV